MAKIGLVTDSSSTLAYAPFEHNIKVSRTYIHFGDKNFLDGVDINAEQFYEMVKTCDLIPSTSAPSGDELLRCFEELKNEGCTDIIDFPISFELSSYGKNLISIYQDEVQDMKLHVLDTKTACLMQGFLVKYAEICVNHGLSVDEVLTECTKLRDNIRAYFVVDDLKYLIKNGRLSIIKGMIGQLLKVKPIIHFDEKGRLVTCEKVRTKQKAVDRCIELLLNDGAKYNKCIYLSLCTGTREEREYVGNELKTKSNNCVYLNCNTITPTVGAHVGAGLVGMAVLPLDGLKFGEELIIK